ncbi:MAG: sulfatase-like hydrolase/transferase [Pseudomonadota bacterium]
MTQPNILFVMTDQQRWDAMGCSSTHEPWLNTPTFDRLAAEGTRFTHCVTTTPICIPARVTLATGHYPHNNAVWNNIDYTMPGDANNWMRVVRDLGYRTSLFGKTHLHPHRGDLRDQEPLMNAYGLDDVNEIGGPRASAGVMSHMTSMWQDKGLLEAYREDFRERFANKPHVARASVLPLSDYADVYVGQQAKQYLTDYDRDQPWFCWVSFGGPHEPWDAPEPWASMYEPATMPKPVTPEQLDHPRPQGWLDYYRSRAAHDFDEGDVEACRANYAGNVSLIDDQVGQILQVIEQRGELDNTIIAFSSDHGEMNGDYGLTHKMNFLNGALRVPLIVRKPGQVPAVNDSMAELVDVGPTLVELAGGEMPYQQFGQSLVSALDGSEHRDAAISEFRGEFMLMTSDWKMAVNREGQIYLLFDRQNDPREERNVAGLTEMAGIEKDLLAQLVSRISQSQLKTPV